MSAKKTKAELLALLEGCPELTTHWRHRATGKECYVIGKALLEATQTPLVVYVGENNVRWARPLDVFLERFEEVAP